MISKPILIAEAAKVHKGSMPAAKEMIKKAASFGCNIIKFQSYDVCDIMPNHDNAPKDRKAHLGIQELYELAEVAKRNNIEFHCSAFSKSVVEPLSRFTDRIKIPSTFFSREDFIEEAAKWFNEIHISTGFHDTRTVTDRLSYYKKLYPEKKLIVYHCVSEYPNTRYNLERIKTCSLQGYSHHSANIIPMVVAYLMGAQYLEFHIPTNAKDSRLWCVDYNDITKLKKFIDDVFYYYNDSGNSEIEKTNYEFFKREFRDLC